MLTKKTLIRESLKRRNVSKKIYEGQKKIKKEQSKTKKTEDSELASWIFFTFTAQGSPLFCYRQII